MFVDAEKKGPGMYYYAITSKKLNEKESFYLRPNQTYTTDGVKIKKEKNTKTKVDVVEDDIEIEVINRITDDKTFKLKHIRARKTRKGVIVSVEIYRQAG